MFARWVNDLLSDFTSIIVGITIVTVSTVVILISTCIYHYKGEALKLWLLGAPIHSVEIRK